MQECPVLLLKGISLLKLLLKKLGFLTSPEVLQIDVNSVVGLTGQWTILAL